MHIGPSAPIAIPKIPKILKIPKISKIPKIPKTPKPQNPVIRNCSNSEYTVNCVLIKCSHKISSYIYMSVEQGLLLL